MKKPIRFALSVVVLSASLAAQGQIVNFDFSFQNTIGTVSGTVTGEILGLTDNSTGPATEVLITGFPAGMNNIAGPTPINAMLWDQQDQNSFTVVGGQVVAGGFWAEQTVNSFGQGFQLYVNGDFNAGYNFLNVDGVDAAYVWGDSGLSPANIVPTSSVPDSASTFSLLGMAMAGLGALRRKKVA